MIYTWACRGCGQRIEVKRTVAEYDQPPTQGEAIHKGCSGRRFRSVITAPTRIFVHENEDNYHRRMTEPF